MNEGGEGNGQDIKILLLVGKIMGWVWMLMLFSMFKLCMGNLVFDIVLEIDILLPFCSKLIQISTTMTSHAKLHV